MIDKLHSALLRAPDDQTVVVQYRNQLPPKRYSFGDLRRRISELQQELGKVCALGSKVGIVAENSFEWICADLALLFGGYTAIPIPLQFSREQVENMLIGMDAVLTDTSGHAALDRWGSDEAPSRLNIEESYRGSNRIQLDPSSICKVIHTSGTTSQPKGVIISTHALSVQLKSLASVVPHEKLARYLSLVPYSLLIEQISGIYMPLLCNGEIHLLPSVDELLGSTSATGGTILDWIFKDQPTAAVLPPAVVAALDQRVTSGEGIPYSEDDQWDTSECFLMSGGAPISEQSLINLRNSGISVYQGYGLSENTSVVAWNTPANNRLGSVGRPLPHNIVTIDSNTSEILVKSESLFSGYQVKDPTSREVDDQGRLHTGDIGWIDADGFLFVTGRIKNTIITSAGRNISPEWVESVIRSAPGVEDVAVIGDDMDHPVAVILTSKLDSESISDEIRKIADADLNEVERPNHYVFVKDTQAFREKFFTVTGRPRRSEIHQQYLLNSLKGI